MTTQFHKILQMQYSHQPGVRYFFFQCLSFGNLFLPILILAVHDAGVHRSCNSSFWNVPLTSSHLAVLFIICMFVRITVLYVTLQIFFCFASLSMIVLKTSPQQNGHKANRFIQKPYCWVNPIMPFPALDSVFVDSPRASQRLSTPCLNYKPRAPTWLTSPGPKSTPTHSGHILVRVTAFTPDGCWQLSFFLWKLI